eukprot:scaffold10254_cov73-Isochrysis_galbana.AAC.2
MPRSAASLRARSSRHAARAISSDKSNWATRAEAAAWARAPSSLRASARARSATTSASAS